MKRGGGAFEPPVDDHPPTSVQLHGTSRLIAPVLLVVFIALVYYPLVRFPYVQDDWAVIHALTFHPVPAFLLDAVSPGTSLFYRPLGLAWCAFVYALFGLRAVGFHLLSLVLLTVSSFLVVSIGGRLSGDRRIAWGSGFVFAMGATVHCDTQMWLVGVCDIGATLFSLLCVLLFLRRRNGLSALALAIALAFKESAITLPAILLPLALVVQSEESSPPRSPAARLSWFLPHGLILVAYGMMRIPGPSILSLPSDSAYYVQFFGRRVIGNVLLYGRWGLEAVTPVKNLGFSRIVFDFLLASVMTGTVILFASGAWRMVKRGSALRPSARVAPFVSLWILLALAPAATLVNHPNKYYLITALAPVSIGVFLLLRTILSPFRRRPGIFGGACALIVLLNLIDGTLFIREKSSRGAGEGAHATSWDGDNHLIRKASVVGCAWEDLLALYPSLPERSVIVFQDVETECFLSSLGPQVWYGDSTIMVADIVSAVDSGRVRVAPRATERSGASDGQTYRDVPAERVFRVPRCGRTPEREESLDFPNRRRPRRAADS